MLTCILDLCCLRLKYDRIEDADILLKVKIPRNLHMH